MQMIDKSVQQLYQVLCASGINQALGLSTQQMAHIARNAVYLFVGFCILSILVMIGHHLGIFKTVHTRASRAIASCMILFGVYLVALIAYSSKKDGEIGSLFVKAVGYFRLIPQMSIAELILFIIMWVVLLGGSFLVLTMIWYFLRNLPLLIIDNILSNGLVRGLILSVYDLGSGLFWAMIIYCAICGALFIVFIPIFIALIGTYDSRRYVIIVRD